MNLEGTQTLITGGSSGIGLATAKQLVEQGNRVHSFDLQEPLEQVDGMQTHIVSVCNESAIRIALTSIQQQIQLLILNAGILDRRGWKDLSNTEVRNLFAVNVAGQTRTLRAVVSQGKLAPHATVVHMCSTVGLQPSEKIAPYSQTKETVHDVIQLVRDLRPDLRVKGLYPNSVETPMTTRGFESPEQWRKQAEANWDKVTQPEDIAKLIIELIEDDRSNDLVWDAQRKTHVLRA